MILTTPLAQRLARRPYKPYVDDSAPSGRILALCVFRICAWRPAVIPCDPPPAPPGRVNRRFETTEKLRIGQREEEMEMREDRRGRHIEKRLIWGRIAIHLVFRWGPEGSVEFRGGPSCLAFHFPFSSPQYTPARPILGVPKPPKSFGIGPRGEEREKLEKRKGGTAKKRWIRWRNPRQLVFLGVPSGPVGFC